jgi:hypothetical protein
LPRRVPIKKTSSQGGSFLFPLLKKEYQSVKEPASLLLNTLPAVFADFFVVVFVVGIALHLVVESPAKQKPPAARRGLIF